MITHADDDCDNPFEDEGASYRDRQREVIKRARRKMYAAVADIGEIPPVANLERRAACEHDLELFLSTYFPNSTGLSPFSDDHRRVIARIQQCCLTGGRFTNCVYRGFAKTTISQNAAIWATIYGHRRYVVIFGAEQSAADDNIAAIKTELSENDLLYEDFPEVCHSIRALEGKPQRCASQTCDGKLTGIGWKADRVILPAIEGSKAGGAIIASRGITGSGTRGLNHRTTDGTAQRPDCVIIDDVQTDRSAVSAQQVAGLLRTIKTSILKLAGHNRQIAVVVNATVIAANDVIEQLLDPKKNPSWQGERIAMVRQWATAHEQLWLGKYQGIRNSFNRDSIDDQRRAQREATAYYVEHREEMDAGCLVSWAGCYDRECEVSAIQHAYNFLIDDGPEVFASECQNQPLVDNYDSGFHNLDVLNKKLNGGYGRGQVPTAVSHLTGFIDVQQEVLFWCVVGWEQESSTGYVVDYGCWPDQKQAYFSTRKLSYKLSTMPNHKGMGVGGALSAGLDELTKRLCERDFARVGGGSARLDKLLIDSGWMSEVVYDFCRRSPHKAVILPSKGRGITASTKPFDDWPKRPGEVRGKSWLIAPVVNDRSVKLAHYDSNHFKTHVSQQLVTAMGDCGCLSFFDGKAQEFELFFDHLVSESPVKTEGYGRQLLEWKNPSKRDNHWWDCLAGAAVAAAIVGVGAVAKSVVAPRSKRQRVGKVSW